MNEIVNSGGTQSCKFCRLVRRTRVRPANIFLDPSNQDSQKEANDYGEERALQDAARIGQRGGDWRFHHGQYRTVPDLVDFRLFVRLRERGVNLLSHAHFTRQSVLVECEAR